ncbi:CxxC motif-containing protein [Natronincola peptidivorans]|uniref:CxxC motif-containing protein n=1 Tax=Natronincola peptidivorans TaxID=426128 RepID=A0A1I0DAP8_9FIRM|nr:DUF1667 domain-containing protein [Natronincola peptidivorans]SET28637.1 CxxC motif-containing protein [Natronincola peptidivorans]
MKSKEMVCIVCPLGCKLEIEAIDEAEGKYKIEGYKCPRGEEYGINEFTNPTRVLTSTVKIKGAHLKRLPVKTNGVISKYLIKECMEEINAVEVEAPVKMGDVIIANILDTGVDITASRSM